MDYSLTSNRSGWNSRKAFEGFQELYRPISNALTTVAASWKQDDLETKITILENLYSFYDYLEVYNFIKLNDFLVPLLFEANEEINNYFPNGTSLTLKVENDEELNHSKLYILINSPTFLEKSLELLDLVDEKWWADAMINADFKLNIDLEY